MGSNWQPASAAGRRDGGMFVACSHRTLRHLRHASIRGGHAIPAHHLDREHSLFGGCAQNRLSSHQSLQQASVTGCPSSHACSQAQAIVLRRSCPIRALYAWATGPDMQGSRMGKPLPALNGYISRVRWPINCKAEIARSKI